VINFVGLHPALRMNILVILYVCKFKPFYVFMFAVLQLILVLCGYFVY
jgi:hypothetical protein